MKKLKPEVSNLAKRNDALNVANLSETVPESFKLYKTFSCCFLRSEVLRMSQNWETSGGYALPWPVHKTVLENTKPPLMHVSSKDRVLRLTVTAWHESEIFQTRGIECVWTESSFSEHDGDFARGNPVLKIVQNSSEKHSDLPLTVTNWKEIDPLTFF